MGTGWPKGKPRGPMSEVRRKALVRSGQRSLAFRKKREAAMAAQHSMIDISPAVWASTNQHIGDCQFVDDGLDEIFLRALDSRVVYADRLGYHEPPFQEITITALAAVEKQFRKDGKRARRGLPKALLPARPVVTVRKIKPPIVETRKITLAVEARRDAYEKEFRAEGKRRMAAKKAAARTGLPLTAVVAEMFRKEGKPLTEVVSEMFDS